MSELRKLIEQASTIVDTVFEPHGQMFAHIVAVQRNGNLALIACPMSNADEERAFRVALPQTLRLTGFRRWCFFSEAWFAEYDSGADPRKELPADRPDRMEVVTFAAEDGGTGEQMRATRQIWRAGPEGPGRLLPLVFPKGAVKYVIGEQPQRSGVKP